MIKVPIITHTLTNIPIDKHTVKKVKRVQRIKNHVSENKKGKIKFAATIEGCRKGEIKIVRSKW